MASEGVLAEATYHRADYVLVVSGLQFHEIGLWLLDHYDIPIAVVMTESPYQDADQVRWIGAYQRAVVFTHERVSAKRYGWNYLPHAYDPAIHRPVPPDPDEVCDVLLVGSGWPEVLSTNGDTFLGGEDFDQSLSAERRRGEPESARL